jgi:hypothetical protein
MRIIGCDLHARQQTLDITTDEVLKTLQHEGNNWTLSSRIKLIT